MYEFECQLCSRVHRVKRKRDIRKYCPGGCKNQPTEPAPEQPENANKTNTLTPTQVCGVTAENYDRTLKWTQGPSGRWICPYVVNVACSRRRCDRCGWHPQVAEERQQKIIGQLRPRR